MQLRKRLLQFAKAYLGLLVLLAFISLPPWPKSTSGSALSHWQWVATSARFQLIDVALATCLALAIGLFTSLRALNRHEQAPPLGRVQQVAFALPFLLFLAVWRTRAGTAGTRFDVCVVAGVLQGLTLGRYLCERALSANERLYLDEADAPLPGSLSHLWREQSHTLWLTASRLALTCIALDALVTRLGFGRAQAVTWGDFLGAPDTQSLPSAVVTFAVFGTVILPWALFALGFHLASNRQAR